MEPNSLFEEEPVSPSQQQEARKGGGVFSLITNRPRPRSVAGPRPGSSSSGAFQGSVAPSDSISFGEPMVQRSPRPSLY